MPHPKKTKLNPLPTRPTILPEEGVVNVHSLPCGFVNSTNDVDIIHNTRCFAIETAQALFASPKIASFLGKHSAEHKRHTEANETELSNFYTCALATARDLVYITAGGALAQRSMPCGPASPGISFTQISTRPCVEIPMLLFNNRREGVPITHRAFLADPNHLHQSELPIGPMLNVSYVNLHASRDLSRYSALSPRLARLIPASSLYRRSFYRAKCVGKFPRACRTPIDASRR